MGYFVDNAKSIPPKQLFQPLIVLNETHSGLPLAVIEGTWITGIRTAAKATDNVRDALMPAVTTSQADASQKTGAG